MYELPIERGKIREFARAVLTDNPLHDGPDAVIPPTFLTTGWLTWAPPSVDMWKEIGFDMARMLHGEEEYIFHGPPPRAGQTLIVEGKVVERYEKAGKRGGTMRFATVVHEFRDANGRLVAEQRMTAIETEAASKGS